MTDGLQLATRDLRDAQRLVLGPVAQQLVRARELLNDALEVISVQDRQLEHLRFRMAEMSHAASLGRKYEMHIAVARQFNVTTAALRSEDKTRPVMRARWALCWLLRNSGISYPAIGQLVERDHSTVMHAIKKAEQMMTNDAEFAAHIATLKAAS